MYDEPYVYDQIGNITTKGGTAYTYPTTLSTATTSTQPHAVTAVGTAALRYDANGNLVAGNGRSLAWTADNLVASVTGPDGVVETYGYDADGERVTKQRAGTTTVYLEGMWEEEVQTGVTRQVYTFNSDDVAQRTRATGKNEVVYLHSDHLGSVSVTTNAQGALVETQLYDPWGRQRAGNLAQTSLDFTGQRRDDTGLG